ncbi:hypothetical protein YASMINEVIRUS_1482 [Yasminevirus sp. GU-2018]|uniref:Uncharacterized protein n=1 Tax=Yasminevirus sp. GU-2018 TaxID=2420051 RepID=A0A5K0UBD7_9VIRU|nr:hypothetical protein YASMINEVIRUS_1482 [Yasminevirus sp. GU-2018]
MSKHQTQIKGGTMRNHNSTGRLMYASGKLDYVFINELSMTNINVNTKSTTATMPMSGGSKNKPVKPVTTQVYQMKGGGCGGDVDPKEDPASGSCGGKSYE